LNDLGAWGTVSNIFRQEDFLAFESGHSRARREPRIARSQAPVWASRFLRGMSGATDVVPSEGGHSDFAPPRRAANRTAALHASPLSSVSWELILSGRGFRTIHEFLAPKVMHATFEDPDADPAPEITRRGLDKSCRVCSDTLDLWTAIYGAEAEILALKVLALAAFMSLRHRRKTSSRK